MQTAYKTERLLLRALNANDAGFIFELVNTAGWIKFIGDRNIKNKEDADNYIQKILANPAISYRVVTLQEDEIAIGVVTFIKRIYLDHPDIGFAFLPKYNKKGYAYEAANAVLTDLLNQHEYATILATTISENISSIQLLKKLGFNFTKEIRPESELLQVFSINKNA